MIHTDGTPTVASQGVIPGDAINRLKVETGATVNASGEVVQTFCVVDTETWEQVGDSYDTYEEAAAAVPRKVAA